MLQSVSNEGHRNQRSCISSCVSCGCMAVLAAFVILAIWIAHDFRVWQQCRIPLPNGYGSVIYMVRLNKILCAEYDRKIRVQTKSIHGRANWIPGDTAGCSPVNVYWYPAHGSKGPYLRFQDPMNEYLVDIHSGKALLIMRLGQRNAYAGEISTRYYRSNICAFGSTVEAEVDGRPAHKLESRVALRPGRYIGRISESYWRFIPSKESPEQQLPH